MQKILPYIAQTDIISFALGLPAVDLFPTKTYEACIQDIFLNNKFALQYSPPTRHLKSQIVSLMEKRGVRCYEEQIFITSGAQQGISLLTRLLLNPKGQIIVEDLAYPGLLQAIAPYQPSLFTVRSNFDTGIDIPAVEEHLKNGVRPAFIYTISDGHNPLGISMSWDKRVEFVNLAQKYGIPIIEDDAYGFLNYEEQIPSLRSIDSQCVFYIGTFSKILGPSLRVGWIVVPERFIDKLSIIKESYDINTATLSQHVISNFIDSGNIETYLSSLRQEYKLRRDAMAEAIIQSFPSNTYFKLPTSGIFMWVGLPSAMNTNRLFETSIKSAKVSFIPGAAFSIKDKTNVSKFMRLNFSFNPPEKIKLGISKLSQVINNEIYHKESCS